MRSVNKVIIIGNLTRNPEMRQTPSGQSVTTFGIATNREWMTKDGAKKDSAEFHECVAWARLAEICANYLKKGNLVYVEGYLKTRSWDSPEGIKKFKTEIVVQDMIILEKRKDRVGEEGDESYIDDDYIPTEEEAMGGFDHSDDYNEPAPAAENPAPEAPIANTSEPAPTEERPADQSPIDKDLGL